MLRDLLNFEGVNWWVLLGGLGLNFITTVMVGLVDIYLRTLESISEFYGNYGAPFMVLVMFLACALVAFIVGKIADDLPLKHAVWSALGAVVPLLLGAVLFVNPNTLMLAIMAVAGAFNGGLLATPRRRYGPPPRSGVR
jgi:multidrug transporter EmrE-like cation transporter